MIAGLQTTTTVNNTTHKVVLPFYFYAALSFLAGNFILVFSVEAFTQHYFHQHILAITHIMALGWGTMMIFGASHQLVPVLIEGNLYSIRMAWLTFILAAIGIPLLVYGFYHFNMGIPAKWGGRFVLLAVMLYVVNIVLSVVRSHARNVHTIFILAASFWLFLTAFFGLILVYNFTFPILTGDILKYIPLHAHVGIIGWFLLLVIGVGAKLIPMFMISKYSNNRLLWLIFALINGGLLLFIFLFFMAPNGKAYFIPLGMIILSIVFFIFYCYKSYTGRIRKNVDTPMQVSLLSVLMMLLPVLVLISVSGLYLSGAENSRMAIIYGFVIFSGWITAMILGMTFKTLPFIVWNKVYHQKAGVEKTPNPKDLFSGSLFLIMSVIYLTGFLGFIAGVYLNVISILQGASILLFVAALLYFGNVVKVLFHKPG